MDNNFIFGQSLIGLTYNEAEAIILKKDPEFNVIKMISHKMEKNVFKEKRVRVYVSFDDKVSEEPRIG